MCRQGASVIENQVLKVVRDRSVRAFVVWVPILSSDHGTPGPETLGLVPDRRAAHFWDAAGRLPRLFSAPLGLGGGRVAWDVYLIYRPGMRWEAEPPPPTYWQHQLGHVTTAPRLD